MNLNVKEGDVCPVCGKARFRSMELLGTVQTFRIMCDCESAARDAEDERRAREERELEIRNNRDIAFTEKRLRNCTFETDDRNNPMLTRICRNYAEYFEEFKRQNKGLLLYGTVGNGKTFMTAAIINKLIDDGRKVMMTNLSRIINRLWSEEDKNSYLDSMKSYELMVIDDFGVERETEYINEKVYEIIDARYRSGLPLIITSNLTGKELRTPGDVKKQRIYSRLFEMCIPFKVEGKDRREAALGAETNYFMNILKGERE